MAPVRISDLYSGQVCALIFLKSPPGRDDGVAAVPALHASPQLPRGAPAGRVRGGREEL